MLSTRTRAGAPSRCGGGGVVGLCATAGPRRPPQAWTRAAPRRPLSSPRAVAAPSTNAGSDQGVATSEPEGLEGRVGTRSPPGAGARAGAPERGRSFGRFSVCAAATPAAPQPAALPKGRGASAGAGSPQPPPSHIPASGGGPLPDLSGSLPGGPLRSRAAYQGFPGAYSEMACLRALPGYEPLPCEQFETAFQALSQWMADRAVLPVENSLGGSIHAVYDLLLRYRLHIVGEIAVPIEHCLLALPGVRKTDVRRALSHPQALAQTEGYLRNLGVTREAVDDTAGAARLIAERGWRDAAAVASRRAGDLYGLEVLEDGIQDDRNNVTRFIILSRDATVSSGGVGGPNAAYGLGGGGGGGALPGTGAGAARGLAGLAAGSDAAPTAAGAAAATGRRPAVVGHKTSIAFTLRPGPGMLFRALSVFSLRDIDLSKIESRPMRGEPLVDMCPPGGWGADPTDPGHPATRGFNYLFYIDFLGSLADEASQNALRHLQEFAPFLRILGSYPRDLTL